MSPTKLSPITNDSSKIQLERISHVYFEHENVDAFHKFAGDFGFVDAHRDGDTVYYRGYGKDQYIYVASKGTKAFKGAAFVAQTQADFDKAAGLDGAVRKDLSHLPGGGELVSVSSPSGFIIHIMFGQEERSVPNVPPTASIESLGPLNGSLEKPRRGKFQRFHPGPAMVHKLGHYGYIAERWDEEVMWHCSRFNFVPSDIQYAPDNEEMDLITFIHLDLGERYSDHHLIFFVRAPPGNRSRLHHTSYEVEDFDTQLLGHQWLADKGYKSVWGVGRHVLGSQIFDYWNDPSGFIIEHYADGDVVNVDTGTKRTVAGPLAVWGPEVPKDFVDDGTSGGL